MPKHCKQNNTKRYGVGWSPEERRLRRENKVERMKERHANKQAVIVEEEEKDEDAIPNQLKRQKILEHDTEDKIEEKRFKLHISKIEREVEALRERLKTWDEKEEQERQVREEQERMKQLKDEEEREMQQGKRKRKKRPGPESWKLRGAARPAWEVYDFDTRYVCPHIKAHEEAKEKSKRIQNILVLYAGKMQQGPDPFCYQFLSLLVQLGHLYMEQKKHAKARHTLLECIHLEGDVAISNARYKLLRMYLNLGRIESAKRLCKDLSKNESAWIQCTYLLLLYRDDAEKTSTQLENAFHEAVNSNVFCVIYLAFFQIFSTAIEYSDDIEDAKEGTLMEAIEYCSSELVHLWKSKLSTGIFDWLKTKVIKQVWSTIQWEKLLAKEEAQLIEDSQYMEEDEEQVDVTMYVGMFRTGVEMVIEAQNLK